MAFLTELWVVHNFHFVSIDLILDKTRIICFSMNRFTSKSFRRLVYCQKKKTYPDRNSCSFADCKGRHKAISIKAPDLLWRLCNVMVLQVRLICELKPTQHFGVKFWCVKQRSGRETLSRLSRNCPTTQNRSLAEPGTFLSWIITNYPVSSGKLIITPPT